MNYTDAEYKEWEQLLNWTQTIAPKDRNERNLSAEELKKLERYEELCDKVMVKD